MPPQVSRERQLAEARAIEESGTLLLRGALNVAKRNPLKVSLYFLGLLICFFFSGLTVPEQRLNEYTQLIEAVDLTTLDAAEESMHLTYHKYQRSRGWFWTCNSECQRYKATYERERKTYDILRRQSEKQIAHANSKLGIFSIHGVQKVRDLFWTRFNAGKRFATNQSKWDMLFIGFRAMGRDESFIEYIIQIIANMLMNFTIGVTGAALTFIYYLWGVISTFEPGPLVGGTFFILASIAAISFCFSWLLALYFSVAGTTYVAAKLIASNMRIENDGNVRRQLHRD